MGLEIVQLLYNHNAVMPQDGQFYERALQDIEKDGIQAQIYMLLKQQGRLSQTPVFFQNCLKESYEKGLYQNLLIKNQTITILNSFESSGIDVIPLKGVLFAEKFFGNTGARITSDIDLLIRYHDLEKAIQIINSLGFNVKEEQIPGHFHCSYSKKLPHSSIPLVVELHWSLVKESTSKFDITDLWMQAKPVGFSPHIMELSPNHIFYMICLHGWRHNLDSMKYFLDIIQVIDRYNNQIDYDEIIALAKSHRTFRRIVRTLSIVYQEFPHLNQVKDFPFKKKIYWEYRPVKGVKKYIDFVDYQFLSYDTIKHSLVELKNWIWPSQYELSSQVEMDSNGFTSYWQLYKKRVKSMFKSILPH